MARPLRIEYPGAYYHIINRGNAGENVFPGSRDKEGFLALLAKAAKQFGIGVHAYCVMSNHYHFLIQTSEANLSSAMQWLNVSYAVSFNRRNQRRGHVFGGRFKGLLVDAEEYLTILSRYIHLNPVRAKMVGSPREYPWSSYRAVVGEVKRPDWLETRELLSYFAPVGGSDRRSSEKQAIRGYRHFIEDTQTKSMEDPGKGAVAGTILGGTSFVRRIQERFLSGRPDEKDIPQLTELRPRVSPEEIIRAVSREFDCGEQEILEKGHKTNTARDVAIFLSRDHSRISSRDLGKIFGGISGSAVSERCKNLKKALGGNIGFRERVERIERRILDN